MLLDLDRHSLPQRQAADAGDKLADGPGQLCSCVEAARVEDAKVDRISGAVERQRVELAAAQATFDAAGRERREVGEQLVAARDRQRALACAMVEPLAN